MSQLTYVEYEQNFLAEDFEEEDIELADFEEDPFDEETQVQLRYGFGVVNVTITEDLNTVPLRSIIERFQEELGFRDINEISARTETGFVNQNDPADVGTQYMLAAVGDRKGY